MKLLDCGHKPTKTDNDCLPGVGHINDNSACYDCMAKTEEFYFGMADRYTLYVDDKGEYITNWTGKRMARIYESRFVPNPIGCGSLLFVKAVEDKTGNLWSGKGPGKAMYINIHRRKG